MFRKTVNLVQRSLKLSADKHSLYHSNGLATVAIRIARSVGQFRADPEPADSIDDEMRYALYRRCWKKCVEENSNSSSAVAVMDLINGKFNETRHEEHCSLYKKTKTCALSCLSTPNHEYYLRPFFRRNYLNEFICVKHFEEFRQYLPCYKNHRSLEKFFLSCGYFALDDQSVLMATAETCSALRCVTQTIPKMIKMDCATTSQRHLAKDAGSLMQRMVSAFLRERVKLAKMQRLCEGSPGLNS